MRKRRFAILFLIIALIFLIIPADTTITGNIINENFGIFFSYSYIIGFIFLLISIILFVTKQSLDAIIIPTGGSYEEDRERTERAEKEYEEKETKFFVISGRITKPVKDSQVNKIYRQLRQYGVKPSQMTIEGKSSDSLENILYSLKKIKEREEKGHGKPRRPIDVGVVSYPGHLDRFKDFEEEAVKKGLIGPRDFRFHGIKTKETPEERSYEKTIPRRLLHWYKLRTMGRYKSKKDGIKYIKKQAPFIKLTSSLRDKKNNK